MTITDLDLTLGLVYAGSQEEVRGWRVVRIERCECVTQCVWAGSDHVSAVLRSGSREVGVEHARRSSFTRLSNFNAGTSLGENR